MPFFLAETFEEIEEAYGRIPDALKDFICFVRLDDEGGDVPVNWDSVNTPDNNIKRLNKAHRSWEQVQTDVVEFLTMRQNDPNAHGGRPVCVDYAGILLPHLDRKNMISKDTVMLLGWLMSEGAELRRFYVVVVNHFGQEVPLPDAAGIVVLVYRRGVDLEIQCKPQSDEEARLELNYFVGAVAV